MACRGDLDLDLCPFLAGATSQKNNMVFRAGRRWEEHLLTASLFLDKTLAANIPVWIFELGLVKSF